MKLHRASNITGVIRGYFGFLDFVPVIEYAPEIIVVGLFDFYLLLPSMFLRINIIGE
jgi:hypothetical protein